MKQLTVYGLALLLVGSSTVALAGGGRHDGGDSGGHYNKYRSHHGSYYKPYAYNRFRTHYGARHQYSHRYSHNYYARPFLGAALLGSAFSYGAYHLHNGSACYQDHSNDRQQRRSSSNSEVVGCHRIERLEDGSERRVEVPMSQCR